MTFNFFFFMAIEVELFFNRKHNVVTNRVMLLQISSTQVLCYM